MFQVPEEGRSQKAAKSSEENSYPCSLETKGEVRDAPAEGIDNPLDPWRFHRDSPPESVPLDLLPRLAEMASSQDEREVLQGVLLIRKLLAVERNTPIQEVVDVGVCKRLVAYMQHSNSELQLNASWALSNVVSGNSSHAKYVRDLGAVPLWIQHLSSINIQTGCTLTLEQAAWALGNYAGDGAERRDDLLKMGVLPPLLDVIQKCPDTALNVLRTAVWALSNLCRFKPKPALNHIVPVVPVLATTLQHPDIEIALDSLWALSNICGSPDRMELVINSGVVPLVVNLLDTPHDKFHFPALQVIGNICSGNDSQTQIVIDTGCLRSISQFLDPKKSRSILKEATWLLANLCAGSTAQIQAVIEAGLLPAIVSTIKAPERDVKKEAVWACANLATNGTSHQIKSLVEAGVLEVLCESIVTEADGKIVNVALETILEVTKSGATLVSEGLHTTNIYVERIRSFQGELPFRSLLSHSNSDIQQNAQQLLDDYFVESI